MVNITIVYNLHSITSFLKHPSTGNMLGLLQGDAWGTYIICNKTIMAGEGSSIDSRSTE